MRIELANFRAERRLQTIADAQYFAERELVYATYPEVCAARVKALDEIYLDLVARIKRGEV